MKEVVGVGCAVFILLFRFQSFAQVDTCFIYNSHTPYGTLDLRLAKSANQYYYLEENKTFSFRRRDDGTPTNSYYHGTSWDSSPYTQGNLREKNGSSNNFVMNYRLLFPLNYMRDYPEGYPLVVMLHGAGMPGNCWQDRCLWATEKWDPNKNSPAAPTTRHPLLNNDRHLGFAGANQLAARNLAGKRLPNDPEMPTGAFPGFGLAPQNLNGWDANAVQDVIRIIRLLIKTHNIDPDRIYVYGSSNGGLAVYDIIKRAPWLFAAALPMSAPTDTGITSQGIAYLVKDVPLWIFQGKLDGAPSPGRTQGYVRVLRESGADVRYTEYANLGHTTWPDAMKEPDFYSWMLAQKKSKIHILGGITSICNTTGQGVTLSLSEGFFAYQWEHDGEIVPDSTRASFLAGKPGSYRARFSRVQNPSADDWNEWSQPVTITTQEPVQPVIEQLGTVLLKDLNGGNSANLRADRGFTHYYWYKDGTLLDLPGAADDTVRNAVFQSGTCTENNCSGDGAYSVVVARSDNCPSIPSKPVHIIFSDFAPTTLDAPLNFQGEPIEDGGIKLTWSDNSSNETGFEVWRRRKLNATTFSKWEMASLVPTNNTSFTEAGLVPSSTYHYKIRAVGTGTKSNYTPHHASEFLEIQLLSDLIRPTQPKNLSATTTGIREIYLKWDPSSDNTGIQEYIIRYGNSEISTGSKLTEYKLRDLPLNEQFKFTVLAKDLDGNISDPSAPVRTHTYITGLLYEHSIGMYNDIDSIDWSFVEFRGAVRNFDISNPVEDDFFKFNFTGYLYIDMPGTYQFELISDDGSQLSIDDRIVVDNDGIHEYTSRTGDPIYLTQGPHLINCKYFDRFGPEVLNVRYKGPDTQNQMIDIPSSALNSGDPLSISEIRKQLSLIDYANQRQFHQGVQLTNNEILHAFIYPNPASATDNLTLKLEFSKPVTTHINVVDMVGRSYYELLWRPGMPQEVQIAPDQQMFPGLYIVTLQIGDTIQRKKVIVRP